MNSIKALVLTGDGINCEKETEYAFRAVGIKTQVMHINDLIAAPKKMRNVQLFVIPGGFSFGDEIHSGRILALKLRCYLFEEIQRFVKAKKPILGICNGFQVLVNLGLLPYPFQERKVSLVANKEKEFVNTWSQLLVHHNSVCQWTTRLKEKEYIHLPVRHAEGRLIVKKEDEKRLTEALQSRGQIPFSYQDNFNGSFLGSAALCDPSGTILGMMPHPEAFFYQAVGRLQSKDKGPHGEGKYIFDSIVDYLTR